MTFRLSTQIAAAGMLCLVLGCGGSSRSAANLYAPGPLPTVAESKHAPSPATVTPEYVKAYEKLKHGEAVTLQECTAIALSYNHDLWASQHGENLARLAHNTARALLRPTLTHRSGVTHQFTDVPTFPGPLGTEVPIGEETSFEANTTLAWVIFDFGQRWNQSRAAKVDWEAARIASELARANVRFLTAQAFYNVKEAQARVRVLENQSLPSIELSLEHAKRLEDGGRATKSDTMLLEVARDRTAQDLRKARDAVRSAVWKLNQTMGVEVSLDTRLTDEDAAVSDAKLLADDQYVEGALRFHPALRRGRAQRRALELEERSAKGAYLPSLGVAANHQYTNADSPFVEDHTVTGSVNLNWPLYQGGSLRTRRAIATERKYAKESDIDRTAAEIERSVREARMRLDQIDGDRKVVEKAVKQAEVELENVVSLLNAGRGATRRDELDARLRLERQRLAKEQLVYARHVAVAALELAVGGRAFAVMPAEETPAPQPDVEAEKEPDTNGVKP